MSKKKIIIIGGGGHARVLKEILDIPGQFEIIGFTDLEPKDNKGIKYLGKDKVVEKYSLKDVLLVNGIGSVELPTKRQEIYERFKMLGYGFCSVIHPKAIVSSGVNLAEGVQIMAGVVINTGVSLSENVIVNTSVTIDHDCSIGAHTHIAPGVTRSGGVVIGKGCHIGTGVVVIQGIKIGEHTVVGAGSLVVENISSKVTAFGVPAKIREQ